MIGLPTHPSGWMRTMFALRPAGEGTEGETTSRPASVSTRRWRPYRWGENVRYVNWDIARAPGMRPERGKPTAVAVSSVKSKTSLDRLVGVMMNSVSLNQRIPTGWRKDRAPSR